MLWVCNVTGLQLQSTLCGKPCIHYGLWSKWVDQCYCMSSTQSSAYFRSIWTTWNYNSYLILLSGYLCLLILLYYIFFFLFLSRVLGGARDAGESVSSVQEWDRHGKGPEGLRAEKSSLWHWGEHEEGGVRDGLPATGTHSEKKKKITSSCYCPATWCLVSK